MAYAQATLTSANAANDFVTVLNGLLTTTGWATVETLTPSGNLRNRVYKSAGTSNQCGYDWYLVVRWTTIGTENFVEVWGAQSYNSTTHIVDGVCGGSMGSVITAARTNFPTGFFNAASLNLNTVGVSPAVTRFTTYGGSTTSTSYATPGFQTLVPSSAFAYWMSVTLDHVGIFTTVSANFQNAVTASINRDAAFISDANYNQSPIVSWGDADFKISSGLLGITPSNSAYRGVHASYSGTFGSKLPALADTYYPAYAWKPYIYFDYLLGYGGTPTFENGSIAGGKLIGAVIDFYLVYGGSVGDTVTISGATYVLTGVMDSGEITNNSPTIALLVE